MALAGAAQLQGYDMNRFWAQLTANRPDRPLYDLQDVLADITQPNSVNLTGHSLGGNLVFQFGVKHPDVP